MKTRKPFATISYNTPLFLDRILHDMLEKGIIEFYAFIEHLPEDDETKKHIHLYVEPNGEINTLSFCDKLKQPDVNNPDSPPLGCIRCVSSRFSDWYMYSLHDVDYLATKLETRKYHYSNEDFWLSNTDVFKELIHTSDLTKYKAFKKFRECVESGQSFRDLFSNGFIPVQQINQYERAYYLLRGESMPVRTYRNGRKGHELVDADGVVVGTPIYSKNANTIF